jgi:Calcineurin-like phosphoesterase
MNLIRFIGDVHGKYRRYRKIIKGCKRSIQLGDMGVGFIKHGGIRHGSFCANPPFDSMSKGENEFIRGNHDNPSVCKRHKFFIPDGTVKDNMMFVGGAVSIDRPWRIPYYSWWPDEEPSLTELNQIVDVYSVVKPEIMATHECPRYVAEILLRHMQHRKFDDGSRCKQAFQSMFEMHKPKLWLFGHYHYSFDEVIEGTRFICLNELEYKDIDIEKCEEYLKND